MSPLDTLRSRLLGCRTPRVRAVRAMSLVEVLVAMTLFSVVGALLLGLAVATSRVAERTQADADATEEARLAIQRLGRELRQASSIDEVTLTATGAEVTSIQLSIDFNGDGVIDEEAYDPEVLTYRWDPDTHDLTLTGHDLSGDTVTRPVLAGGVETFELRLRSSQWAHDADGDGITTWQELDASTLGNHNSLPDAGELDYIDIVSAELTVVDDGVRKNFTVQSDLRNQRDS